MPRTTRNSGPNFVQLNDSGRAVNVQQPKGTPRATQNSGSNFMQLDTSGRRAVSALHSQDVAPTRNVNRAQRTSSGSATPAPRRKDALGGARSAAPPGAASPAPHATGTTVGTVTAQAPEYPDSDAESTLSCIVVADLHRLEV